MAKKQAATLKSHQYHCEQCAHHYDEHDRDVHGEFFMAKCPFKEFSVFMRHDWCERFKLQ